MSSQARTLINPDARWGVRAIAVLTGVLLAASFAGSASALVAVTAATNVDSHFTFIGPVIVDGAIIVFSYIALVLRQRGQNNRVVLSWTIVALTTTLSAALNVAHAIDGGAHGWVGLGGRGLAAYFPILVLLTSYALEWLIIATPAEIAAQTAADEAAAAAEVAATAKARVDTARRDAQTSAAIEVQVARVRAEAASELAAIKAQYAPAAIEATPAVDEPRIVVEAAPTAPTTPRQVVTDEQARTRVLEMHAQGISAVAISRELGGTPSRTTVGRIIAAASQEDGREPAEVAA